MERLVLLVEDETERKFYETVVFLASAVRESGAGDEVIPALQALFSRTWDGTTPMPAGPAR